MKFGVFYEHQLPRPWEDSAELRLFQEALDQVELADRLGIDYAWEVKHHYVFGKHTPGRTNIWNQYLAVRDQIGTEVLGAGAGCIGTPEQLRETLRIFQDAGVDQTIFIQQGGKNRHEHICESLELFAAEVMPEFREKEAEREKRKLEELGPAIEAAFARKRALPLLADDQIPTYQAYGNTVALTDADIEKLPEGNRRRVLTFRRIAQIAEGA